jgi:hypothetical protein
MREIADSRRIASWTPPDDLDDLLQFGRRDAAGVPEHVTDTRTLQAPTARSLPRKLSELVRRAFRTAFGLLS